MARRSVDSGIAKQRILARITSWWRFGRLYRLFLKLPRPRLPPAPNVVKPAPVSLVDVTRSAITRGELTVTHIDKTASLKTGP